MKRAGVGTADTDVHHVIDGLTGVTFPLTGDNRLRESFHFLKHGVHFRHHIFADPQ